MHSIIIRVSVGFSSGQYEPCLTFFITHMGEMALSGVKMGLEGRNVSKKAG